MWDIYDALIGGIPPDYRVDEVLQGDRWTMVRSGDGVGLAMTLHERTRPDTLSSRGYSCEGMALAELAMAVKSWNFGEASLGMAAINAYWNSPEHDSVIRALEMGDTKAFNAWRERVTGKKVVVVGHFSHLEQTLGDVCDLSVLEKRPCPGDFPDSACEFLLPSQDFVFATGVTFTNKTLPRLLELAGDRGIILAGPSVPLAPLLFDWGALDLQGFVVTDPELCRTVVGSKNRGPRIFEAGRRVSLSPEYLSRRTG